MAAALITKTLARQIWSRLKYLCKENGCKENSGLSLIIALLLLFYVREERMNINRRAILNKDK